MVLLIKNSKYKEERKMKKKNIVLLVVLVLLLSMGCAGHRQAELEVDETGNIEKWSDKNHSLLQPSMTPTELGRADVLRSKADLNRALATQISQGKTGEVAGSYVGLIINSDRDETLYLRHPNLDDIYPIKPGGSKFIVTNNVPEFLLISYESDDRFYEGD